MEIKIELEWEVTDDEEGLRAWYATFFLDGKEIASDRHHGDLYDPATSLSAIVEKCADRINFCIKSR